MEEFNDLVEKMRSFLDDCAAVGNVAEVRKMCDMLDTLSNACDFRADGINSRLNGFVGHATMWEERSEDLLNAAEKLTCNPS